MIYSFSKNKLFNSKIINDSFWAVFGNGFGNAIMLLSGIIIARCLGSDLYGQYGIVKTTMFHIAAFSTFGLGYTSTKFVAEYIQINQSYINNIVKSSVYITLFTSFLLAISLFIFSNAIALFVNSPDSASCFKYLAIIIIFRAINTVTAGILGGFKCYKVLGINNIISSLLMLLFSSILTFYFSLNGSLIALLLSQIILSILNLCHLYKLLKGFTKASKGFYLVLLKFSYPIAMQEFTYFVSALLSPLLIIRYSSAAEYGIYTACAQWNSVILFIPTLLSNVVLSYLSSSHAVNYQEHNSIFKKMLIINLLCALIPFFIVLALSNIIENMYGRTFDGMSPVLNILVFSSVFVCCSSVFTNKMISEGKNWLLFILRGIRDVLGVLLLFILLETTQGVNVAFNYALLSIFISFIFLVLLIMVHCISFKRTNNRLNSP